MEGFSGVGKSHYIKWLQAKINSDDKYHIVWFRRNINFKEIFNLILDPFKDDPLFSEILDEIDKEFSSIERQPGVRFQSGLQLVLREVEENLQNEIKGLRDQEIDNSITLPKLRKNCGIIKPHNGYGEPSLMKSFLKETFQEL